MATYRVKVIIRAEVEYEAEVEASSEHEAEDKATGLWREKTPDDFQVSKGYITDWDADEVEQLTHVCEDCGVEYPADRNFIINGEGPMPLLPHPWDSERCLPCGNKDPELAALYAKDQKKQSFWNYPYAAIRPEDQPQEAGSH